MAILISSKKNQDKNYQQAPAVQQFFTNQASRNQSEDIESFYSSFKCA